MKNKINIGFNVKVLVLLITIILIPSTLSMFCVTASLAQEKKEDAGSAKIETLTQSPQEPNAGSQQGNKQAASQAPEEVKKPPAVAETGPEVKSPSEVVAEEASQPAEGIAEEAKKPAEEVIAVEPGNVTVNFRGAEIKTVLAYISEVSGVDIVPAPDVKGIVDLKLTNKPWKVALDIIVRNYGFAYEREGDIIRVVTIDKLKQEEPVSQAFNLNYSKAKVVADSIKSIVTEKGKVNYDDRTNTVIVTDIPTNIYKIAQIVERLDRRTPQVLIEARVIETVLDDTEKLGIDWNVKFSASGARRPTTLPFEMFKTPFGRKEDGHNYFPMVQSNAPQAQTIGGVGTVLVPPADFPANTGGSQAFPFSVKEDFTFGTLDFSEFKAVLEMIKSRDNTNIVSNPRIATLNNTEAMINVGQTLNLPKYERNSSTGKMEITGYDAKNLGIILKVTPHVNDNNEIVIDLFPEISDLLRYDTLDKASGVVAPVFSARQARTQVMIKDGETIFIGGLIKENNVDSRTKLPIIGDMLGDIPYLGLLFTKKGVVKQKTELIFFITVNLMSTGKEIIDVPKSNKAYVPLFTNTQNEDPNAKTKRKKRGL